MKVSAEAPPNYISPALRGFEERRLKGSGKYLSEKELRAAWRAALPPPDERLETMYVLLNAFRRRMPPSFVRQPTVLRGRLSGRHAPVQRHRG